MLDSFLTLLRVLFYLLAFLFFLMALPFIICRKSKARIILSFRISLQ